MNQQMPNIFQSDVAFIEFISTFLVTLGVMLFLMGLSCNWVDWFFCELHFVNFFGLSVGIPVDGGSIVMVVAAILMNLSALITIVGLGMKIRNHFGWSLSLGMLIVMFFCFLVMLAYVKQRYDLFSVEGLAEYAHPFFQAMVFNASFASVCALGIVYLLLPNVRAFFWQSS